MRGSGTLRNDPARTIAGALGHQPAFECSLGGAPIVYFDTLDSIGRYIELWDNSAVFKDLFQMVEDAAIGWDGHDPVRALPR